MYGVSLDEGSRSTLGRAGPGSGLGAPSSNFVQGPLHLRPAEPLSAGNLLKASRELLEPQRTRAPDASESCARFNFQHSLSSEVGLVAGITNEGGIDAQVDSNEDLSVLHGAQPSFPTGWTSVRDATRGHPRNYQ
jgi:hypothetical protein